MESNVKQTDERDSPWQFWWQCQWKEWFIGKWNWRNFTVINLSFERSTYAGRCYECEWGLIGIVGGFSWREPASTSVWLAEMDQIMAEARDNPDSLVEIKFAECDKCHGTGTMMLREDEESPDA